MCPGSLLLSVQKIPLDAVGKRPDSYTHVQSARISEAVALASEHYHCYKMRRYRIFLMSCTYRHLVHNERIRKMHNCTCPNYCFIITDIIFKLLPRPRCLRVVLQSN